MPASKIHFCPKTSAFSAVHFHTDPLSCKCEFKKEKNRWYLNFTLNLFSRKHGSERVTGVRCVEPSAKKHFYYFNVTSDLILQLLLGIYDLFHHSFCNHSVNVSFYLLSQLVSCNILGGSAFIVYAVEWTGKENGPVFGHCVCCTMNQERKWSCVGSL